MQALTRIPLCFLVSGALVAGCSPEPHGLAWGFRFDDPTDRAAAIYVEATIHQGNCDGPEIWRAEIPVATGASMDLPPELEAGGYGLRGRARDVSCAYIASGCETVTLPREGAEPLIVVLFHQPEGAACAAESCMEGRCVAADAGAGDAGRTDGGRTDGGRTDGGRTDGGARDGGVDGFVPPSDGCIARPEICDMDDDDCDGRVDETFDLDDDDENCGECNNDCHDANCVSGTCTCPSPFEFAGGWCVDPMRDPTYCGASLIECDNDEYCSTGSCVCRPGLTRTGSRCVDLQSDPSNCGALGTACAMTDACSRGICASTCGVGLTACSRACVDLDIDVRHCGGCFDGCSQDEVCQFGNCEFYVPALGCSICPCSSYCNGDIDVCVMTYGTSGPICVD